MTVNQFATLHPDKRFTCYDLECVVQDGEIEVPVSMIAAKAHPPSKLVIFHEPSKTFEQMSTEVSPVTHYTETICSVCAVPTALCLAHLYNGSCVVTIYLGRSHLIMYWLLFSISTVHFPHVELQTVH